MSNFKNSIIGNSIRKEFSIVQYPLEPFKRNLTNEETKLMYKHFKNHSWSKVDSLGLIILGGGEHGGGIYFITEEDLKLLN